jgi:hypothetical protein
MSKTRAAAPSVTTDAPADSRVYVTASTVQSVPRRRKPLPPDANAAATACKLYQLQSHVEFRCTKCRRDKIVDDSLAVDEASGVLMCARCYARLVKPRLYKPTRLVPFPSLLSWLSYEPAAVATHVPANVAERGAEAAVPSGHRVATEMIAPTSVAQLPTTPMNPIGHELDAGSRLQIEANKSTSELARAAVERREVHPCVRVFGRCAHGALCFFRNAPYNLSLSFLMGLRDGSSTEDCTPVFDLPSSRAPPRSSADFEQWIAERKNSANQAEWQLWNQPDTMTLVDSVVPPVAKTESPAAHMSIGALKNVLGKI